MKYKIKKTTFATGRTVYHVMKCVTFLLWVICWKASERTFDTHEKAKRWIDDRVVTREEISE